MRSPSLRRFRIRIPPTTRNSSSSRTTASKKRPERRRWVSFRFLVEIGKSRVFSSSSRDGPRESFCYECFTAHLTVPSFFFEMPLFLVVQTIDPSLLLDRQTTPPTVRAWCATVLGRFQRVVASSVCRRRCERTRIASVEVDEGLVRSDFEPWEKKRRAKKRKKEKSRSVSIVQSRDATPRLLNNGRKTDLIPEVGEARVMTMSLSI